jgi:hypothetical protein
MEALFSTSVNETEVLGLKVNFKQSLRTKSELSSKNLCFLYYLASNQLHPRICIQTTDGIPIQPDATLFIYENHIAYLHA